MDQVPRALPPGEPRTAITGLDYKSARKMSSSGNPVVMRCICYHSNDTVRKKCIPIDVHIKNESVRADAVAQQVVEFTTRLLAKTGSGKGSSKEEGTWTKFAKTHGIPIRAPKEAYRFNNKIVNR